MIFDAHGDILTDLYIEAQQGRLESFRTRHLERYKNGGVTHSIFVNWTDPKTTDPDQFEKIFDNAFQELDAMADLFQIVRDGNDLKRATDAGKIGVIIGIEGLGQLKDIDQLRHLYSKGVRHASLTWNDVNRYAAGLNSETDGLTLLGREVLDTMEELGMIIDLAHANAQTFDDIIEHTTGPVIISHGNAKARCDHIRNYTDEQLRKIQRKNGVVGVCGIAPFLSSEPSRQTVHEMAEHIHHMVKTIGIDHVGLGFDVCYYLYDNVASNRVEGFQTIADAGNVLAELRLMGYNDRDIEKIAFGNFARIVRTVLR